MWELFTRAGIVAWPLGFCSILAVGIILERIFTLTRLQRLEERAFMMLQLGLESNDDGMLRDQRIAPAPVTRVIDAARTIRASGEGPATDAADIAISAQRLRLRRYLSTLATIGSTAPFIGLFGTVLGVMRAFQEMSKSSLSGEAMAAGISEALSATALGLMVAIPAVIAYNYLTGRAAAMLVRIQGHAATLMPLVTAAVPEAKEGA